MDGDDWAWVVAFFLAFGVLMSDVARFEPERVQGVGWNALRLAVGF